MKISLRLSTGELFYTIINGLVVHSGVAGTVLDLGQMDLSSIGSIANHFATILAQDLDLPSDHQLVLTPIPEEALYPQFSSSLTVAPEQMLTYCYVKGPYLLAYDPDSRCGVGELMKEEAKICEILLKNPHPNIAKYWGCEVVGNRIRGLCFGKYVITLQERIDTGVLLDIQRCLQGIKNGILHLHGLGLVHNDINPTNIMMDPSDNPVIIDFDACMREGEKLFKLGTPGWSLEGMAYAAFENDFYGLSKLEKFLTIPPEQDDCFEQD